MATANKPTRPRATAKHVVGVVHPKRAKSGKHAKVQAGSSKNAAAHKRALFVEAFLANGENATQAAISAGYSPKTAGSAGGRLLQLVEIQDQLARRRAQFAKTFEVTAESTTRSLAAALNFDFGSLWTPGGKLKQPHELDPEVRKCIQGVKTERLVVNGEMKDIVVEYIWQDRVRVREQAMRKFNLYAEENRDKNVLDDLSRKTLLLLATKLAGKG